MPSPAEPNGQAVVTERQVLPQRQYAPLELLAIAFEGAIDWQRFHLLAAGNVLAAFQHDRPINTSTVTTRNSRDRERQSKRLVLLCEHDRRQDRAEKVPLEDADRLRQLLVGLDCETHRRQESTAHIGSDFTALAPRIDIGELDTRKRAQSVQQACIAHGFDTPASSVKQTDQGGKLRIAWPVGNPSGRVNSCSPGSIQAGVAVACGERFAAR